MKTILGDRFWSKVEKTEGCWNWTASKNAGGYGQFSIDGVPRRAHRLSYEDATGEEIAGMEIDHRCHNRACVNPRHLRAVTRKQNSENLKGARGHNRSGVRGVSWFARDRRWHARVMHEFKSVHIGYFDTIPEAEAAVIAKRNELFTHNDHDRIPR